MMLRVRLPGALYRLALDACQGNNGLLNAAIVQLLETDDWLEQTLDAIIKEKLELDTRRAEAE
jgi:hypothetical protein